MSKYIYRIAIPIEFKVGITPGAGSYSNYLFVAVNGEGKYILHGSSITGVLRKDYESISTLDETSFWFGSKQNGKEQPATGSKIKIADVILNDGNSQLTIRTHNAINRHTGAALENGLFSIETLPPGTKAIIQLEIDCSKSDDIRYEKFIRTLADLFTTGMFFGGNKNRGIGLATASEGLFEKKYDISTPDGYAELLDSRYSSKIILDDMSVRNIQGTANNEDFIIELILNIPRGEDLLVGDGQTLDYVLEPQKVNIMDGLEHWRIPGSTFRGIFRAWMTRQAAREGIDIRDSFESFYGDSESNTLPREKRSNKNDSFGWAFVEGEKNRENFKQNPEALNDPIYSLFGSLFCRGRIHFSDSLSIEAVNINDAEERIHVAIDRFTGGANEGALFANKVLINSSIEFPLCIKIKKSDSIKKELRWLLKTLKALHLGILSIGSSKSSGRLAIKSIKYCSFDTFKNDLNKFLEAHK